MSGIIPPGDLLIYPVGYAPPGGQQVARNSPGIRATHIPTGITATCEYERSQHRNKIIAVEMLESALTSPNGPRWQ